MPPSKPLPSGRKRKRALDAFRLAHETLCGKPSGKTEFDVTCAHDPSMWFYQAVQTSALKQGPKTPREFLNPDCDPRFKNQVLLTNLHVSACIGWHWAEDSSENKPWAETLAHWQEERLIALGAVPLAAPEPADAAWQLHCILHLGHTKGEYTAIPVTRFYLALGHHRIITEHLDPENLIEHIRAKSIERIHGKPVLQTPITSPS